MPRRYNEAIYKDSVGALLQQQQQPTGSADRRRKGGTPAKNYRRDNRANIKEIEAINRQRRVQEAAPAAEPFKLRQFKNVKSRFASAPALQGQNAPESAKSTPPGQGSFLRRGAREKEAAGLRQEALRRRQEGGNANSLSQEPVIGTAAGSKLFGAASKSKNSIRTSSRQAKTAVPPLLPPLPRLSSPSPLPAAAAADGKRQYCDYSDDFKNTRRGHRSTTTDDDNANHYRPTPSSEVTDNRRAYNGPGYPGSTDNGSADIVSTDNCGGDNNVSSDFDGGGSVYREAGMYDAAPRFSGKGRGGFSTPRKEAVPKAGDVAQLAPRSDRDFVAANRMKAAEMKAKGVRGKDEAFTHDSYGMVPGYLVSRQEEWEREAERRRLEAPDPSCPPGMKLMPEEERLETLRLLEENESVCQSQLNQFPLVVQTPLLKRRVDDINKKLKEIDAAKLIFGRPRVYIVRET